MDRTLLYMHCDLSEAQRDTLCLAFVTSALVVCCSMLQCVTLCCIVLQCVAVCRRVMQCVAVCCSVLQCVAVWSRRSLIYSTADCQCDVTHA